MNKKIITKEEIKKFELKNFCPKCSTSEVIVSESWSMSHCDDCDYTWNW